MKLSDSDPHQYNIPVSRCLAFEVKKHWLIMFFTMIRFVLNFRAETVYEDMKQRYGSQGCYLLKINSRAVSAEEDEQIPDPWSQYLHKNNLRYQVSLVIGSLSLRPSARISIQSLSGS